LFAAGGLGVLVGLTIVLITGRNGVAPLVPWTGPITVGVLGLIVGALAYYLHQRLQVYRIRMEPRLAVGWLAVGKAAGLVGALLAGGYFGFAVRFVTELSIEAPRERVIRSAVAVACGIGTAIAGRQVERACQVPGGDNDDENGSNRSGGQR
jgi:D-serine dehydratase